MVSSSWQAKNCHCVTVLSGDDVMTHATLAVGLLRKLGYGEYLTGGMSNIRRTEMSVLHVLLLH